MTLARFLPIPLVDGGGLDLDGVLVRTWGGAEAIFDGGTVFACVTAPTRLRDAHGAFSLVAGMWAVLPDGCHLSGGQGLAVVVPGYRGLRAVGGPIEARGRLRYIDGCTDTLLAGPARLGEPCLNHLHIPAATRQSTHTHPSLRAGVIARGAGTCVTAAGRHPLTPGLGWVIPTGLAHAFHTDTSPLDVLAWHPETDTGPTDTDHPMLNRTLL
jgi:hypothetical protein